MMDTLYFIFSLLGIYITIRTYFRIKDGKWR